MTPSRGARLVGRWLSLAASGGKRDDNSPRGRGDGQDPRALPAGGGAEGLAHPLLAAQVAYADSGTLPGLLSIYQLLADPALKIP